VVEADGSIDLDLPATPDRGAEARKAVALLAAKVGASYRAVELAVGEAFANAVLHAYRGRRPGTVNVTARIEEGELEVVVADDGIGMSPNLESSGLGFGLPLIAKFADRVEIRGGPGGGTVVRMGFQLDHAAVREGVGG
jgi:anti-sigma regulatory factor (Ser/Thr protein kinase)